MASSVPKLKGKNVLVVVTGASRGIGRELAVQLARYFASTKSVCTFILLARSEEALEEVKEQINKEKPMAKVEMIVADLAKQPFEGNDIGRRIRFIEECSYDLCLVFHNAGSIGEMAKKSSELSDEAQWHDYMQTNLFSTILLNNQIYAALEKKECPSIFMVNITSLLSVKAYPSFTQYSTGKAAREAYFRAFAVEHPHIRVLNYSPGPVDTKMHSEVQENSYDVAVREVFSKRRHDINLQRKLLTPDETVRKLIDLLEGNKFESGARVDYFDA